MGLGGVGPKEGPLAKPGTWRIHLGPWQWEWEGRGGVVRSGGAPGTVLTQGNHGHRGASALEAVCLEGPGQQGRGVSHGQNPSGSPPTGTEAEINPIASHNVEIGFLIL